MTLAAVFSAISLFADREGVLTARDYTAWTVRRDGSSDRIDGYLTASGPSILNHRFLHGITRTPKYELSDSSAHRRPIGHDALPVRIRSHRRRRKPDPPVMCVRWPARVPFWQPDEHRKPVRPGPGNGNWQGNGNIAFQGGQKLFRAAEQESAAYYNDGESMVLSLRNP